MSKGKMNLEIAKALQSNDRKDFLFALKQEFQTYNETQKKIEQCDKMIARFMDDFFKNKPELKKLKAPTKSYKRITKNTPKNIDLNQVAYKYFGGVDLIQIEGVSHSTVLSIMSEIGPEGFKKFQTGKQFAFWLRLAPNNKISGGRIFSNKIPKGSNRLKTALRQAANVIGNLKNANLHNFFIRISIRKGRSAAITATARKLAIIIWNMVINRQEYKPINPYEFLDEKRKRIVREMQNKIAKFGIQTNEFNFSTS